MKKYTILFAFLLPSMALADGFVMRHMGYNGGFSVMGIGMVVFWLLLLGGLLSAGYYVANKRSETPPQETAHEIVKKRFARGDIDAQEMKKLLGEL